MKKTLVLSVLCLVLLAVRGFTQAPDLPSGLEDESENEEPALPSGLDEAEEEARGRYELIVSAARDEGDRLLNEARDAIEEERRHALEDFRREAVDLAQLISEKVLSRRLDERERQIVEEELQARLEHRRS